MIAKSLIYWKENYFGCWFPFQTFLINKKYFGWLMILTVLSDQYHSRICRLIFTCLIWGSGKRKGFWKLVQNFIENSSLFKRYFLTQYHNILHSKVSKHSGQYFITKSATKDLGLAFVYIDVQIAAAIWQNSANGTFMFSAYV